jgi:hypothetical protein
MTKLDADFARISAFDLKDARRSDQKNLLSHFAYKTG